MPNRGGKIPIWMKQFIAEESLEQRRVPRRLLAENLRQELKKVNGVAPKVETIERLISKVRSSTAPVDGPWSLGASVLYKIPPEANGDLFKILRWCTIVDREFTIREAQWVARLRGVVSLESLLYHASLYAIRERACEALGATPSTDTSDLDAMIAFTEDKGIGWGYSSLVRTKRISNPTISLAQETRQVERNVAEPDLILGILGPAFPIEAAVDVSLHITRRESPALPQGADMVYAIWLRHFSKEGKKWPDEGEARNRVAERLYTEVFEVAQRLRKLREQFIDTRNPDCFLQAGQLGDDWELSKELLAEVGLSENSLRPKEAPRKFRLTEYVIGENGYSHGKGYYEKEP